MRSFSATDAAFAGFRFMSKNLGAVLMWTLVSFFFLLGVVVLFALFAGASIASLMQLRGAEPTPEQIGMLFMTVLPAFLLILPLALIFNGVMIGGINRAILRPGEGGFFYLRLGADEMRLAVVLLVQAVAGFAVNFVASMIQGIFQVGAIAASGGDMEGIAAGSAVSLVLQLVTLALLVFLNVKFCLALPQSFAKRTIDIFGTWSLTNGRFWPIFGAYLLCGVICVILTIVIVGTLIGVGVGVGINIGLGAATEQAPNMGVLIGLGAVALILYGLLLTVVNTAINAVAPDIYRQIAGDQDPSTVFS